MFGISKIPTHCLKKALITWPLSVYMKSYGNNCVQYEVPKFRVFLHFRTKLFCKGYLKSRKSPTIVEFMYFMFTFIADHAFPFRFQLQAVSCSNCHDVIHYNALGYALRPWNMTKNYNATSYTKHKMLLKGLLVYQGILSQGESCYITKSRCTQPFFHTNYRRNKSTVKPKKGWNERSKTTCGRNVLVLWTSPNMWSSI